MPATHSEPIPERADLTELYEEGRAAFARGDNAGALDLFKEVHQRDYGFRDVADIVKVSADPEADWIALYWRKLLE